MSEFWSGSWLRSSSHCGLGGEELLAQCLIWSDHSFWGLSCTVATLVSDVSANWATSVGVKVLFSLAWEYIYIRLTAGSRRNQLCKAYEALPFYVLIQDKYLHWCVVNWMKNFICSASHLKAHTRKFDSSFAFLPVCMQSKHKLTTKVPWLKNGPDRVTKPPHRLEMLDIQICGMRWNKTMIIWLQELKCYKNGQRYKRGSVKKTTWCNLFCPFISPPFNRKPE